MPRHQTGTRRDLALRLLREAGRRGVTTGELLAAGVGSRYSARLLELRDRGYAITSERIDAGQWRYRLGGEPAAEQDTGGSRPSAGGEQAALFDLPARSVDPWSVP